MILSLLLLTQEPTLRDLMNFLGCLGLAFTGLGLWILLEVLWLGHQLKKAGKL